MKNPPPHNISQILDESSLKGLFFLFIFASLILAKCALSESLRIRYEFGIDTSLYIWTPSLVLGFVVSLLYIGGPGSPFSSYWKSSQFMLPASLIALATSFSIVRNLPSTVVPLLIALLLAGLCLTLGRYLHSKPVAFLAAIWLFGGWVALFLPPTQSYGLFSLLLLIAGTLPATVAYLRYKKAYNSSR